MSIDALGRMCGRVLTCAALLVAITIPICPGAAADEVADFYANRTVTLVIGHETGTGYDLYGRAVARHIGRHVPGRPTVVAQNMPGASGLVAANWLYNIAAKDGTVIATFAHTAPFEPLVGRGAAKFETIKFLWLGNADESVGTCGVWHTSGVAHFDDILARPIIFGSSGPTGPLAQFAYALRNIVGAKITLVEGYKGSNDVHLALQRGEIQGTCGDLACRRCRPHYAVDVKAGHFKPIIQLARDKHPDLAGVAHVYDYAKSAEDAQVFDLIFGRHALGRPFAGPPGVPPARAAALRKALMATLSDAAFLDEARKQQLDIRASSGEQVEALFARFFALPRHVVDRASKAVQGN